MHGNEGLLVMAPHHRCLERSHENLLRARSHRVCPVGRCWKAIWTMSSNAPSNDPDGDCWNRLTSGFAPGGGRGCGATGPASSWAAQMTLQPADRVLEHLWALAEGEARIVAGGVGIVVERRNRDRGDAGLFGDVPAERDVVAVEPKRGKISGDEIRRLRRQYGQSDSGQTFGELIPARLKVCRQGGEIG